MDRAERLHFETIADWHAWLVTNHTRHEGVWLVSWKPATGRPAVDYETAVEEALCFGWVDSTARSLDDERGMQWFAPRRKGSLWASSNKERVARLEAQGRMRDAGRAAIRAAKADGSWSLLEPVEALIVPDDLEAAFAGYSHAAGHWKAFSASAKRPYLHWIYTAKRDETRAGRVQEVAELVDAGVRFEDRGAHGRRLP
jgi:uncharacterized protein YdeI (YjbR/CyaY-like superfamily)